MTLTIEIESDVEVRLNELAARTGESKADLLRHALRTGIEDVEDYFDAVAVSERIRRGEEPTYTSAEVRRYLGLDD